MIPPAGTLHGTVTAFDEMVGLGTVSCGDAEYRFHCTEIADGSRVIPVGTEVSFRVSPTHLASWEASHITY